LASRTTTSSPGSAHLEEAGVSPSPVREVPGLGRFVSFEDPDGIQFELWQNVLG
jgi:hypothetical protein